MTLATVGAGIGTLAVSPPGPTHLLGTTATISATPAQGSVLVGWRDDCGTATANPCTISMTQNRMVIGVFNPATDVRQYDGDYSGTWTDQQSSGAVLTGPIAFTVNNGSVRGEVSPISGSQRNFAGTVATSGSISATIPAAPSGCRVDLSGQITTSLASGVTRATANGNYALVLSPSCNPGTGTWTLTRR
ncbi:MAG: InlB B-repeat-containing protein [Gemmatimonadota bacterium]